MKKPRLNLEIIVQATLLMLVPFWYGPATYLLFKTYRYVSSGFPIWLLIEAQVVFSVWVLWRAFRIAAAMGRVVRPIRLAMEAGDDSARLEYMELRTQQAKATRFPLFAITGFFFFLPAYTVVALIDHPMSGGPMSMDEKDSKPYSRRENVELILKAMEERHLMLPWR